MNTLRVRMISLYIAVVIALIIAGCTMYYPNKRQKCDSVWTMRECRWQNEKASNLESVRRANDAGRSEGSSCEVTAPIGKARFRNYSL